MLAPLSNVGLEPPVEFVGVALLGHAYAYLCIRASVLDTGLLAVQ